MMIALTLDEEIWEEGMIERATRPPIECPMSTIRVPDGYSDRM